jgi:hypothetical protein
MAGNNNQIMDIACDRDNNGTQSNTVKRVCDADSGFIWFLRHGRDQAIGGIPG